MNRTLGKRIYFPIGKQNIFLSEIQRSSCLSWKELAKITGVHDRTLRDWRNEKYSMSFSSAQKLCHEFGVPIPKTAIVKEWGSHLKEAGSKGGVAHIEKHGRVKVDEQQRKKKWREWWESEGQFQNHPIIGVTKEIRKPKFSKELAEFVGIVLGDGSISKYHITITLNHVDDKEYVTYVKNLIKNLFEVPVALYPSKKDLSISIAVTRKELVDFCVNQLGLKVGDKVKNKVDIPHWIKCNEQYSITCIRGLFDTDGSVFDHVYKVNSKEYTYKKLDFTSKAENLVTSFEEILSSLDISSNLSKNKQSVRIDAQKDVRRYFKIVGSSNPKHLMRFNN